MRLWWGERQEIGRVDAAEQSRWAEGGAGVEEGDERVPCVCVRSRVGAREVGDERGVFHLDQGGKGELDGGWGAH